MIAQKIKENLKVRAIFVIVVVERWGSFCRILDRQSVPASDNSKQNAALDLDFNEQM